MDGWVIGLGAEFLIKGASRLATSVGVSPLVVGLSVMAGIRGERDIAVGNVVGSNIFNVLAVSVRCRTRWASSCCR